jgi:hypothetical protein
VKDLEKGCNGQKKYYPIFMEELRIIRIKAADNLDNMTGIILSFPSKILASNSLENSGCHSMDAVCLQHAALRI